MPLACIPTGGNGGDSGVEGGDGGVAGGDGDGDGGTSDGDGGTSDGDGGWWGGDDGGGDLVMTTSHEKPRPDGLALAFRQAGQAKARMKPLSRPG